MPAINPGKTQLNLFVETKVNDLFRTRARKWKHGKQPSDFLGQLLKLHLGDLETILATINMVKSENPAVFQSRQQLFFARELVLALGGILEEASVKA